MDKLRLRSFAKINLHLDVLKARKDGYHDIFSIMQAIDLCDIMEFEPIKEGLEVIVKGSSLLADQNNLVVIAAQYIRNIYCIERGIRIILHKNIPLGAGLGGGSSNAACAIMGLNKVFNLNLSMDKFLSMSRNLGADVSFFLTGGSALVKGMGDLIQEVDLPRDYFLVLITPDFGISTRWAYENIWPYLVFTPSLEFNNLRGEFYSIMGKFRNTFEKLVFGNYTVLEQYRNDIEELGAVKALMSGSGSSIFGIFRDEEKARRALTILKGKVQGEVLLCKPAAITYKHYKYPDE
ncbi:4-(cytidine 5'-diphospho)-2-C-methyl-D-erythritol kinase [bacterium]|nr:4-(cytidine 5'-diphospho)-2-C-methyl-D-erythritol kinase [bacterium]